MGNSIKTHITKELKSQQDLKYQEFQVKLIPNIEGKTILGVRTPALRKLAKELAKRDDVTEFLNDLPHKYFEENQLHGFILSGMKDFDEVMEALDKFLPYVDNWATCDQTSVKILKKYPKETFEKVKLWLAADEPYTIRYGIGVLMEFFLDDLFKKVYLNAVVKVKSEEYYVNMMQAWYIATALAKQEEATLPIIEKKKLGVWSHNKSIQKAIESNRISSELKTYLRTLKIK